MKRLFLILIFFLSSLIGAQTELLLLHSGDNSPVSFSIDLPQVISEGARYLNVANSDWVQGTMNLFDETDTLDLTSDGVNDFSYISGGLSPTTDSKLHLFGCKIFNVSGTWRFRAGGTDQYLMYDLNEGYSFDQVVITAGHNNHYILWSMSSPPRNFQGYDFFIYKTFWSFGNVSTGGSSSKTWTISENRSGWSAALVDGTHFSLVKTATSLEAIFSPTVTGALTDSIEVSIPGDVENFPSSFYIALDGTGI